MLLFIAYLSPMITARIPSWRRHTPFYGQGEAVYPIERINLATGKSFEEEYPSILFAKDGEIFELNGKQTVVMGGAYSIDKAIRIAYGWGWWEDEQPSEASKEKWL